MNSVPVLVFMALSFDERADRLLRQAIAAAEETGVSTRGGNLRFPTSTNRTVSDQEIVEYCSEWMDAVHPPPLSEVGWRPRVEYEDNTVIQMLSRNLLQCQGRIETVQAISVIAAGIVTRVPPLIAMACPASSAFWDWVEKYRIPTKIDRPLSSVFIPTDLGGKAKKAVDQGPPSSASVREYFGVSFNESWRALVEERALELAEVDMPYIMPDLAEADRLMSESVSLVMNSYDPGSCYLRTEMEHPFTITTGQLLVYCKNIWHDSELYHLGCRWRPAYMPNARQSSKTGDKRGGIFLPDQYKKGIAIQGSPTIIEGLYPIIAAVRIRLHPSIARRTNAFLTFFDFMKWDPRREPPEPSVTSDLFQKTWDEPMHIQEFDSGRFAHEELMMDRVITYLMCEYNRSGGQWAGAEALPSVSWSKSDSINSLMTWWPEAEIQDRGKFRYVPVWMDKGGLEMYEGGQYFSQQGKAPWQYALMPMAASLICGIPGEIAALLKASDRFWNHVAAEFGHPVVRSHRDRLRQVRDTRFGSDWDLKRKNLLKESTREPAWGGATQYGYESTDRDSWHQAKDSYLDKSTRASSPAQYSQSSTPVAAPVVTERTLKSTLEDLRNRFRLSLLSWAETQMELPVSVWEVADTLYQLSKVLVGGAAPKWCIRKSPDLVICKCPSVYGDSVEICFFRSPEIVSDDPSVFDLVALRVYEESSAWQAALELLAVLASTIAPEDVPAIYESECAELIDLFVNSCLGDLPNPASAFAASAVSKVIPSPVENDPPHTFVSGGFAGIPHGKTVTVPFESATSCFCQVGEEGRWIERSLIRYN